MKNWMRAEINRTNKPFQAKSKSKPIPKSFIKKPKQEKKQLDLCDYLDNFSFADIDEDYGDD